MSNIKVKITVKMLMLIAMTGNHIAIIFGNLKEPHWRLLLGLGYSVGFVMFYYLAEGFVYTSSRRNYCLRLAVFTVLSQYPFYAAFSGNDRIPGWMLNIMFTLLASFCLLWARDSLKNRSYIMAVEAVLILITLISDWALLGPVFTLLFARGREEGRPLLYFRECLAMFFLTTLLTNSSDFSSPLQCILFTCIDMTGPLLAWGLLHWYETVSETNRGRDIKTENTNLLRRCKWLFYLYYPVHLLLLSLIGRI